MTDSVIDLCSDTEQCLSTIHNSNVRKYVQDATGIIELLSDSDVPSEDDRNVSEEQKCVSNEHQKPLVGLRKESNMNEKDGLSKANVTMPMIKFDSQISVVGTKSALVSCLDTAGDNDDECRIIGQNGYNALSDFPHSREDCVVHRITDNADAHCPNCYCFVCDVRVEECKHWTYHCSASFHDEFWKAERNRKRNMTDQYKPCEYPSIADRRPTRPKKRLRPRQDVASHRPSQRQQVSSSPLNLPRPNVNPPQVSEEVIPSMESLVPVLPKVSPWLNTSLKLIGVAMSIEERQSYDAAKRLRSTVYDSTILQFGASASDVERYVTEPLSQYQWSKKWCMDKLRTSSKIQALLMDLTQIRIKDNDIRAIVFCQDRQWRDAIALALHAAKFKVRCNESSFVLQQDSSGEVCIQPTIEQAPRVYSKLVSRVYFMEQHVNMAWEAVALSCIERDPEQVLCIRKLLLKDTSEEKIVDFQNALILGQAKLDEKTFHVDQAGVAIILKGLP